MNDDDYKLIGQAFSGLLEEDLGRIQALLYRGSMVSSHTASRLYTETLVRFIEASKSLREVRKHNKLLE